MIRKMFFVAGTEAITLPVTPPAYLVACGMDVQRVSVFGSGDYGAAVSPKLKTVELEFELPSTRRPYCVAWREQADLLDWFLSAMATKTKLRFLVSGTNVNFQGRIIAFDYGEKDGTNDLACRLEFEEARQLLAPVVSQTETTTQEVARDDPSPSVEETTYTVKAGDCLWNICRQFYGDGTLYPKLAEANGIKNDYIIYAGQVLKIPTLDGVKAVATTSSVGTTTSTVGTTTVSTTPSGYTVTVQFSGALRLWGMAYLTYDNPQTGKTVKVSVTGGSSVTAKAGEAISLSCICSASGAVLKIASTGFSGGWRKNLFGGYVTASGTITVYWGLPTS